MTVVRGSPASMLVRGEMAIWPVPVDTRLQLVLGLPL
jgi:hypothetical protein